MDTRVLLGQVTVRSESRGWRVEVLQQSVHLLKVCIHLKPVLFIEFYHAPETGKTSFALIQNNRRVFGAYNLRGWHVHPFGREDEHAPSAAYSFERFADECAGRRF